MAILSFSCNSERSEKENNPEFDFFVEQFADLRILRYDVPGFNELTPKQKEFIYYLSEAALCGRDILYDQNGKYNLRVRRTLENIHTSYKGDRNSEEFKNFVVYLKRVWFSNGIYHHYSSDKLVPGFSREYFNTLVENSDKSKFPLGNGQTLEAFMAELTPVIFDPDVLPKKVSQDPEKDLVTNSAVNFYENVSQDEAEAFYNKMKDPNDETPVEYGLNTKLVKENGNVKELTWKADGMYGAAIQKIIFWLEKAAPVAESPDQENLVRKLIEYYKSGDLNTWDEFNIIWAKSIEPRIDFVNGFIEVYEDPLGLKATWESVVNFKDVEATKRTEIISSNAQWFENNSPVDDRFKKKEVKGVSAKVITLAQLGGDCYPATPIGINLPNSDWIRKEYGSKSVTLENITYSYDQASLGSGFNEEFLSSEEEIELLKEYGFIAGNIHTDLHECLGHGSGQLLPGVSSDALKNYQSPLEETRADLFALYYIMDPKMVELGLIPNLDAAKAEYISYVRNGLMTQLTRIQPGKNIEQAHMRNRQLITKWCLEKGSEDNVIEKITLNGKTYFKINDFDKLRSLFGELLKEIQRIKSTGDYEAGKALVEKYGVKVDTELHKEVLERYEKLKLAPYTGFVNPVYKPVVNNGKITDITVSFEEDYNEQMIRYSKDYSFLPDVN